MIQDKDDLPQGRGLGRMTVAIVTEDVKGSLSLSLSLSVCVCVCSSPVLGERKTRMRREALLSILCSP
jgi:hypothetical protein